MRVIWTAIVVATVFQSVPGQLKGVLREGLSILCVADFDGDQHDDVILFGDSYGRTYFGNGGYPDFKRGADWQFASRTDLLDVPVFVGDRLYVPVRSKTKGEARIDIHQLDKGVWMLRRSERLKPTTASGAITSLKIHELHKDLDGDKKPDLIAVWGETPHPKSGGFRVAYVSQNGKSKVIPLPALMGQPTTSVVVDVHRIKTVIPSKTPEYTVTFSCNVSKPTDGFGFLTVVEGPKAGAGVWASGGPGLAYLHYGGATSPVCHGAFGNASKVKTPLIHLVTGESLLLEPFVLAPYVYNKAQILDSGAQSIYLNECVADFDGDGKEEVVLVKSDRSQGQLSFLNVGDPSRNRAYFQFFNLDDDPNYRHGPKVFHGAAGDFDGDGDKDMIVCFKAYTMGGTEARLAFFRGSPTIPGKACLKRIH